MQCLIWEFLLLYLDIHRVYLEFSIHLNDSWIKMAYILVIDLSNM